MTYTYRRGELDTAPVYAPYVMREEAEPEPPRHLTAKQIEARRAEFDPSRCGTNGGRDHHLRTGEPLCDPCRNNYLQRQAEYRARKKGGG